MYQALIEFHQLGEMSFKHVITFNLDEYAGLPRNHPQSYYTYMSRNFFQHVDIPPQHIHRLNGEAVDLEAECVAYEKQIAAVGGIDLLIGGVGTNGHIAFNEPGSALASRTRVVPLSAATRRSNALFFNHQVDQVPKYALTMGIATIMEAREVLILACGAHKASAILQGMQGPITSSWPISALRQHANATLLCDQQAAANPTIGMSRQSE
jgi:glucosamine-6-phosphate deaminase